MNISVIIPTYNEAENIEKLIYLLEEEIKKFPHHIFDFVVVDGNSTDGTGKIVENLSNKFPNVHHLPEKQKSGLGSAYIYGFGNAVRNYKAQALVEMDADFQHSPEDFSKLISEFDNGYDYVLGSRYVRGGSIPKQWSLYRKILSVGGSLFTKIVLGIFNISDFTTGFKVSRVEGFVDRIDLENINSSGFAYKIDLLYKMHKLGAKIKEVPIKFGLRDRGSSKMERENFLDSLKVVLLIRYNESRSFFKFLVVGFTGLFVDSGIFSLLRLTLMGSSAASYFSGFLAMVTTFCLNNFWSFKESKFSSIKQALANFGLYFGFSYIPIIFRSVLIKFANQRFGDNIYSSYSAFFIGILLGLIWNYLVYSRIIWKRKVQSVK